MKCSNGRILVHIGNNGVKCPKKGGVLKNCKTFSGEINCPRYDLICTSSVWCNDALDCINKKSTLVDAVDTNDGSDDDYEGYDECNSGWISFLIRNKIIIFIEIFILLF